MILVFYKEKLSAMTTKISIETVKEVWDNVGGSHIEVSMDRDGLGLVEIRYYESSNPTQSNIGICMSTEEAEALYQVLPGIIDKVKRKNEKDKISQKLELKLYRTFLLQRKRKK